MRPVRHHEHEGITDIVRPLLTDASRRHRRDLAVISHQPGVYLPYIAEIASILKRGSPPWSCVTLTPHEKVMIWRYVIGGAVVFVLAAIAEISRLCGNRSRKLIDEDGIDYTVQEGKGSARWRKRGTLERPGSEL
jgi:hypothetical protein